tara:strand:- start:21 stop:308 length:288 start_codon:yes stop_codon:yes gene_type:complete
MIHTLEPAEQANVDNANKMIAKWYHYIQKNRHNHRGESLRLYIDPRTWHDYIILEFGQYRPEDHKVTMFGYVVEVHLVYGTEREHNYLVYNGDGC